MLRWCQARTRAQAIHTRAVANYRKAQAAPSVHTHHHPVAAACWLVTPFSKMHETSAITVMGAS